MNRKNFTLMTVIFLLVFTKAISQNTLGQGQNLKIGLTGIIQRNFFATSYSGPIAIADYVTEFSYGGSVAYERNKNSLELLVEGFPFKTNVWFKIFTVNKSAPIYLTMWSLFYKRNILNIQRRRLQFYLGAGMGVAKYKHEIIFSSWGEPGSYFNAEFTQFTKYKNSIILLPRLKFEVEKGIANRILLSLFITYSFRNIIDYSTAIDNTKFTYTYNGRNGAGVVSQYGDNLIIGLSLKVLLYRGF